MMGVVCWIQSSIIVALHDSCSWLQPHHIVRCSQSFFHLEEMSRAGQHSVHERGFLVNLPQDEIMLKSCILQLRCFLYHWVMQKL